MKTSSVLFDLDGTLIDTAPDMAATLNLLLQQHDRPVLPFEKIRGYVSKGSQALVKLGFGASKLEEDEIKKLQTAYLDLYSTQLCVHSQLFSDMDGILNWLDAQKISWGIVTNKPGWLTEPLLKKLALFSRANCVVSGDTLEKRKPHPEPLLHACNIMQVPAQTCVYIGDDKRDIDAGKSANMTTVAAAYGYIDEDENIHHWQPDYIAADVTSLKNWLYSNINISK